MSRQTATPPAKPVAALLSPVLWQMEHPDKFDMYSFGILMLQMAFPNLRSDNSLIAFNRRLQELGWDLRVGGVCEGCVCVEELKHDLRQLCRAQAQAAHTLVLTDMHEAGASLPHKETLLPHAHDFQGHRGELELVCVSRPPFVAQLRAGWVLLRPSLLF